MFLVLPKFSTKFVSAKIFNLSSVGALRHSKIFVAKSSRLSSLSFKVPMISVHDHVNIRSEAEVRACARGWEFHACSNSDLGEFLFCEVPCCAIEKMRNFHVNISSFRRWNFLQILQSGNYCLRLQSANS